MNPAPPEISSFIFSPWLIRPRVHSSAFLVDQVWAGGRRAQKAPFSKTTMME
jgi:hypothetical protein